ncbi:MAG: hypothetical protein J2O47_01415, partial [Acidimicrobiaceae bacterium]|nr:hypothetical protein [Acidimicrobiaceae bacterium]
HPVLVQTQAQARENLRVALSAHQDIQAAQAGVQQMNDFQHQAQQVASNRNQNLKPGQSPVQPEPWTGPNYPAMLTDATARFNHAKSQIDAAVQHYQAAGQNAADWVNAASDDGLKNKSHGLFGWVSDVFKSVVGDVWHGIEGACHWVATHVPLPAISDLLGKITMVLAAMSFIPGIGEFADAAALVTGGLMLATDAINAINDAYEGKFTWSGDGLGLGLDIAGVAFGLRGKAIVKSVGKLRKTAEGFTKAADDIATQAKFDRSMREEFLAESRAGLDAAKSGWRGAVHRLQGLWPFHKGPLPVLKAAVRSNEEELAAAIEYESRAAAAAREVHLAMKPFVTTGKTLEKLAALLVKTTNVGLADAGVTHSVSSAEDLPPAHGPLGYLKNVVVNSTVTDYRAIASHHQ